MSAAKSRMRSSYLRLIVNPRDDVAFRRIVNVPKRSLGDSAQEIIEQEAARREKLRFARDAGRTHRRTIFSICSNPNRGRA